MKNKIQVLAVFMLLFTSNSFGQFWLSNGSLNDGSSGNNLGTFNNYPINIYTSGARRAQFTTGGALSSFSGNNGDGLRIRNQGLFPTEGNLDLFTSNNNGQNETHIVFGANGQISGQSNRFEFLAKTNQGFWFNLLNNNQYYKFASNNIVHAFVGNNRFWRIGDQQDANNISANRRLEVVENNWQFRLSRTNGNFTDFQTNANGNLQVLPQNGRVGVNLTSNPTANLDVNGNMRIRNVQTATPDALIVGTQAGGSGDLNVRRLDFNGNANTFLGGDGQFHTVTVNATPPAANNGVSRSTLFNLNLPYCLGDLYTGVPPIFNTNTPLTVDRQVRLNNHNLVFSGDGNIGIGLNYPQLPSEVLDVDGNARLRRLPNASYMADNTVDKVVMVDTTGVLKWIDRDELGNGGGFADCSDMSGVANLSSNSKVNLNNYNLYFENNDVFGQNHIGIGYDCSNTLSAKLSVQQVHPSPSNTSTIALSATNNDIGNTQSAVFTGIEGKALGSQNALQIKNRGGYFTAENAGHVRGIVSEIPAFSTYCLTAYGGEFNVSSDARDNYGVIANSTGDGPETENKAIVGYAKNSKINNIGGYFNASSQSTNSGRSIGVDGVAQFSNQLNIGGRFKSICNSTATGVSIGVSGIAFEGGYASNSYPSSSFIGVYGAALPTSLGNPSLFAGFFDGDVYINGPTSGAGYALTSDILFKTDTSTISTKVADSILLLLKPKSYYMDTLNNYGMNFSSKKQFGLVAQDVENVIPNIVNENHKPAMIDSIGNVITQGIDYKTLNYTELIPLLIAGHQEQSSQIDSLQTANDSLQNQITDLNNRLSQLENCLSGILPFLCQLNQNVIEKNGKVAQDDIRHIIEVELNNGESIVLNQNVPNPFAEKTVITYTIPQSVQEAQIVFYDATGSLIKTIDIRERGNGQINVYAQDLSSGTYTYSLVADGKVVATKRMVKAGF